MLSSKEAKRIMPKAERKMRKWVSKHRFYELLASQAEQYMRKFGGRDADSIELNIFLRHTYGVIKELEEKAKAKQEKWHELFIQDEQNKKEESAFRELMWDKVSKGLFVMKCFIVKRMDGIPDTDKEKEVWTNVYYELSAALKENRLPEFRADSPEQRAYGEVLHQYNTLKMNEEQECFFDMMLNLIDTKLVKGWHCDGIAVENLRKILKRSLEDGVLPVIEDDRVREPYTQLFKEVDELKTEARTQNLTPMPWYEGLSEEEIRRKNAECLKKRVIHYLEIGAQKDKEAWQSLLDKGDNDMDVDDLTPREFKVYCWVWHEENDWRKAQLKKEPQKEPLYKVEMIEEE